MKKTWLAAALVIFATVACNKTDRQWENLAEKDLSGWEQLNGTAPFVIEDGVVTGTTVTDSPNSFLWSME